MKFLSTNASNSNEETLAKELQRLHEELTGPVDFPAHFVPDVVKYIGHVSLLNSQWRYELINFMPYFQLIEMEEIMTKFKPHLPEWLKKKFEFMEDRNVASLNSNTLHEVSECVKDTSVSVCLNLAAGLHERYERTRIWNERPMTIKEYDILYNVLAHSNRVTDSSQFPVLAHLLIGDCLFHNSKGIDPRITKLMDRHDVSDSLNNLANRLTESAELTKFPKDLQIGLAACKVQRQLRSYNADVTVIESSYTQLMTSLGALTDDDYIAVTTKRIVIGVHDRFMAKPGHSHQPSAKETELIGSYKKMAEFVDRLKIELNKLGMRDGAIRGVIANFFDPNKMEQKDAVELFYVMLLTMAICDGYKGDAVDDLRFKIYILDKVFGNDDNNKWHKSEKSTLGDTLQALVGSLFLYDMDSDRSRTRDELQPVVTFVRHALVVQRQLRHKSVDTVMVKYALTIFEDAKWAPYLEAFNDLCIKAIIAQPATGLH